MTARLIVKATAGADGLERCAQALTVAAVAATTGAEVSLWLTGEASWLAVPGASDDWALAHSPPLTELRDTVLIAGGTVTVCSQCAARRALVTSDLVAGVRVAGAAVFVAEVLQPDTQALVY